MSIIRLDGSQTALIWIKTVLGSAPTVAHETVRRTETPRGTRGESSEKLAMLCLPDRHGDHLLLCRQAGSVRPRDRRDLARPVVGHVPVSKLLIPELFATLRVTANSSREDRKG